MRTDMDDQCCGWVLLMTAGHNGAVDYPPLGRWPYSPAAFTEDDEVKKQVLVGEAIDEGTRVCPYQLQNWRYLNAELPVLHEDLTESPAEDDSAQSRAGGGRKCWLGSRSS